MALDLHPQTPLTFLQELQNSPVPFPSEYEPGTWVNLRERPNPYSHDEALLLCENEDHQWLAWVPDHGETRLERHQFFR